MELLVLLGLGFGLGMVFDIFGDDAKTSEPDEEPAEAKAVDDGEDVDDVDRILLTGDEADDSFGFNNSDENFEIYAGEGEDNVLVGSGFDLVFGGDDVDTVRTDVGDDTIYGGGSSDIIYPSGFYSSLDLVDGELPEGASDNDVVYGGNGGDRISTQHGEDILYGGNGADRLSTATFGFDNASFSLTQPDSLYGGDGFDRLSSFGNADVLFGGSDPDTFWTSRSSTQAPNGTPLFDGGPMVVADFDPDEDTINLQPSQFDSEDPDPNLLTVTQTEDGHAILSYDGEERALVLNTQVGDLDLTNITFRKT